jgi:hypothetical protein
MFSEKVKQQKQWDRPPAMQIDTETSCRAVIETDRGIYHEKSRRV